MKIASTQYTLQHKALEIYLSGCDGHCGRGCHNQELWDFDIGNDYSSELPKIVKKAKDFKGLIDNLWILGGEPLLQEHIELMDLIHELKNTDKKIWLFTRYDIEEIPSYIKDICDYIKCGRYIPELVCDDNVQYGVKLSTSNQIIYKK